MSKPGREDIQIISKYSNWSKESIAKALKGHVYRDKASWERFISLFLLVLGVSFSVLGVVFFFAYNWDDLHKFVKIGIIEGLAVIVVLVAFFVAKKPLLQKLLLTSAAMLVGVLYAVFGQVYQTGANAYDFFLGWTLFITIWAVVANFPPLWVIYIALVNTSIILYAEQVAENWSEMFGVTLLFTVNVCFLVVFLLLRRIFSPTTYPSWFTNLLGLTAIFYSTVGIVKGIGGHQVDSYFGTLLIVSLVSYGIGVWYGLMAKRSFYLALIPFSLIIIVSAALLDISDGAEMFLVIGIFIVVSVTLLIYFLNKLQKRWASQRIK